MHWRTVWMGICVGAVFAWAPVSAQEKYPVREIELVIPWSPGGPTDIAGRIFAHELGKILKVPITPVNKAGGSGTIGAAYATKARKDGYTLFVGSQGWWVGSALLDDVPYDPMRDFIPVANVCMTPGSLFVKSDSPLKSLENLIAQAKRQPKSVSCGTAGTGTEQFLNVHIFQKAAGIEFNIVPFKGGGETPPAVLGGHVDAGMGVLSAVLSFAQAGRMRVLAVSGANRVKELPDVPTFREKGFTQTYLNNWTGLFAPAGVPPAAIQALTAASEKAMKSREVISALEKTSSIPDYLSGAEYRARLGEERKVIEAIASETGLKRRK